MSAILMNGLGAIIIAALVGFFGSAFTSRRIFWSLCYPITWICMGTATVSGALAAGLQTAARMVQGRIEGKAVQNALDEAFTRIDGLTVDVLLVCGAAGVVALITGLLMYYIELTPHLDSRNP